MNNEEYKQLCNELAAAGYKHRNTPLASARDYYYKGIVRRPSTFYHEEERAVAEVLFYHYDLSEFQQIAETMRHSLECVIMISRHIDERIDVTFTSPKLTIDEAEKLAVKLLDFFDVNVEPRKID